MTQSRLARLAAVLSGAMVAVTPSACGGVSDDGATPGASGATWPSLSVPASGPAAPPRPSFAREQRGATLRPAPSARPGLDSWDVGARVLPRRSDGFGVVRPTPPELRLRLMPTTDLLPPPRQERFRASVRPVTPAWARSTELAWTPGCPVRLTDLRLLRLTFHGFDALPHTGQLVVHRRVARDVVGVFRTLYEASYPIEQMALVRLADLDAPPTGDGNNTAAYACRATRGASTWSAHAHGLAVDVNPFMNPYVDDDLVLPELASSYTRRAWRRPGMIHRGDVVTRAFAEIGWTWGGDFRSLTDPMHFSATGR